MRTFVSRSFLSLAALCALVSAAWGADLKYEIVYRSGGQESRQTTYMSGSHFRMDMGGDMYIVFDCDTRQSSMINRKDKSCIRMPAAQMDSMMANGPMGRPGPPPQPRKGGIVTERREIADTKERKEIFGMTARHIIVTSMHDAAPDSCSPGKSKKKRDLWLVDLTLPLRCESAFKPPAMRAPGQRSRPECEDEVRSSTVGNPRLEMGFVIKEIDYDIDDDGTEHVTNETEVLSLSTEPLPASVFTSPYECQEFSMPSMMGGMSGQPPARTRQPESPPAMRDSQAAAEAMAQAGQRSGTLLVGVVTFKDSTGKSLDTQTLRQALIAELNAPAFVDAIVLQSSAPADVMKEAQEKHCSYVVYTTLTESKVTGGSKVGGFLGRATGMGSGEAKVSVKLEYQLMKVQSGAQVSKRPVTDASTADISEVTAAERQVLMRATTQAMNKEATGVLDDIRSDSGKN